MEQVGKPKYFNVDLYLAAVEEMLNADELERALWMLDNLPGYYRDNVPQTVIVMKKRIYRQLMDVHDYLSDKHESGEKRDHDIPVEDLIDREFCWPRGPIVEYRVNEYNLGGEIPLIVELAPADYWLPKGLAKKGKNFFYHGVSINKKAEERAKDELLGYWTKQTETAKIFCCFETIEHLWNPDDIFHTFTRLNLDPEYIFLSTPKYTCFGGVPNWHERTLGHLRTYTPGEFLSFAKKHWPNYEWTYQDAPLMVIQGKKRLT